jgi:hypothetical protein
MQDIPLPRLTSWGRVLQKITVGYMVKKLSVLYGTSNFITEFTAARQWTLNVRSTLRVQSARVWAGSSKGFL